MTYLDCLDCEDKECKKENNLKKVYLTLEVGSNVYLVYSSKREGKENIVIKCKIVKAVVYEHSVVYCCEIVKFVTKNKNIGKGMETTLMFENANINTGRRSGINRYPVFTDKERCLEWLRS